MIKIENRTIEMGGIVIELLDEFSIITNSLYHLISKESDGETAKSIINYAYNYGFTEERKPNLKKNDFALSILKELFGDMEGQTKWQTT